MNAMRSGGIVQRPKLISVAVLEDDPSFREALVAALMSLGYLVFAFEAPEAFLASVGKILPACILLDFDLPEMSGLEVYDEMTRQGCIVPTIFVTGNHSDRVEQRIKAAGAVGFLRKPISIHNLENLIKQSIAPDNRNSEEFERPDRT